MHYRITRVEHEPENRDKVVELLDSKKDLLLQFDGLNSVSMVGISDSVTIAISKYDTEEHLNNVEERFREIMVDLMPLLTAPPEVSNGDVFWEFNQ